MPSCIQEGRQGRLPSLLPFDLVPCLSLFLFHPEHVSHVVYRITAKIGWIQEGRTDFSAAGCARITYCLVTTTM